MKGYKCIICGKEYKTNISGSCIKHLKKHNVELDINKYYKRVKVKEQEKLLKCPICNKAFKNNLGGALTIHLMKIHNYTDYNKIILDFPQYKKYFRKLITDRLFADKDDFVYCKICNKKFKRINGSHLKKYHNITLKKYNEIYGIHSSISKKRLKIMIHSAKNWSDELKKQAAITRTKTKKKNGTLNYSSLETKVEQQLENENIEYIREYILPEGTRRYRYDFYIPTEKLLIEVNGTGTHADPRKYKADDILKLGLKGWKVRTAKEIWDYDLKKKNYAEKYNYGIKTIWEKDLDKN